MVRTSFNVKGPGLESLESAESLFVCSFGWSYPIRQMVTWIVVLSKTVDVKGVYKDWKGYTNVIYTLFTYGWVAHIRLWLPVQRVAGAGWRRAHWASQQSRVWIPFLRHQRALRPAHPSLPGLAWHTHGNEERAGWFPKDAATGGPALQGNALEVSRWDSPHFQALKLHLDLFCGLDLQVRTLL